MALEQRFLVYVDNFDRLNGVPVRYDSKLADNQELYIPYNSYKLNDVDVKYGDIVKAGTSSKI